MATTKNNNKKVTKQRQNRNKHSQQQQQHDRQQQQNKTKQNATSKNNTTNTNNNGNNVNDNNNVSIVLFRSTSVASDLSSTLSVYLEQNRRNHNSCLEHCIRTLPHRMLHIVPFSSLSLLTFTVSCVSGEPNYCLKKQSSIRAPQFCKVYVR